jgi:HlyD family secretion protein
VRLDENKPQTDIPDPGDRTPIDYEFDPTPKPRSGHWLSGGRGVILGLGLGALLSFGATRFSTPNRASRPPATPPAVAKTEAPAQSVTTALVGTSQIDRSLKATGTVAAYELIPVLARTNGLQIQEILVDRGDRVSAGQLLARLDDRVLQAQREQAIASVAQAEARLAELRAGARSEEIARSKENIRRIEAEIAQATADQDLARKRLERNRSLEAEGAIARDRLDEALNEERNQEAIVQQSRARLAEAQQQLRQLQAGNRAEVIAQASAAVAEAKSRRAIVEAQLDETRILSPSQGKISERNARIGDITDGQNPLFRIIENGRLELRLQVPETRLTAIRVGSPVTITSDADTKIKLLGRVREIDPLVNEESRQATVKVDLPNTGTLKPGMFLRGAIVTDTTTSLTVPMAAVLPKTNDRATVYRVGPNNTVEARSVTLGQLLPGDRVEILDGVNAGDRIVVKGAAYLGDGDRIVEK